MQLILQIMFYLSAVKSRHPSSVFHLPIVDSVVPSPSPPIVHEQLQDLLAEEIRSAQSTGQLFEIVMKKQKVLEQSHLTMIFRSISMFRNQDRLVRLYFHVV